MFSKPSHILCVAVWACSLLPGSLGAPPRSGSFSFSNNPSSSTGSIYHGIKSGSHRLTDLPTGQTSTATSAGSDQDSQSSFGASGLYGGLRGYGGGHPESTSFSGSPTSLRSIYASPTPTGRTLKHGADPHSGGNYCQDDNGNKFSTMKAPTPSKAYDPCDFPATVTPIPYDTPSKSTMVTDSKGTVWFCPSATPNDARVWSSYDCGPTSMSQSVIPSIASAYEDRVASASASASAVVEGNFMWIAHTAAKLAVKTPRWALYGRQVADMVDECNQDPDQSIDTTQDMDQKHVPWPPTMDGINDVKVGDKTFSGCKYTNTGEQPGTWKCDGYKEVTCIKDQSIDQIVACAHKSPNFTGIDWFVAKVNCVLTEADSEGKLPL